MNPHNNLRGRYYYLPHSTEEESCYRIPNSTPEAQERGFRPRYTCLKLLSYIKMTVIFNKTILPVFKNITFRILFHD